MESLLGFAFFAIWLAPSFCDKFVLKPAFAFKIHSMLKTLETCKWPSTKSGTAFMLGQSPLQLCLHSMVGVCNIALDFPPCNQKHPLIAVSTYRQMSDARTTLETSSLALLP